MSDLPADSADVDIRRDDSRVRQAEGFVPVYPPTWLHDDLKRLSTAVPHGLPDRMSSGPGPGHRP